MNKQRSNKLMLSFLGLSAILICSASTPPVSAETCMTESLLMADETDVVCCNKVHQRRARQQRQKLASKHKKEAHAAPAHYHHLTHSTTGGAQSKT